ncbi:hypothetical protein EDD36DRAFT_234543 [Exophiala viscosa]|uniref:Zn(2)-C6 fungal-type domain-containing protein n=1 Tax=Exophiala viscosa TaxID=2486360 RepID=A0AAN6E027_9EURO|nr:hypothetical protein EDD36DRAFT_234543 [Exophiala viscosa]
MDLLALMDSLPKRKQKNCDNCVSGKRRCDRRKPVCSRCAHKRVSCIYGRNIPTGQFDHGQTEASMLFMNEIASESPTCSPVAQGHPPNDELRDFCLDPRLGDATTDSLQNFMINACFDGNVTTNPFTTLIENNLTPNQDPWLFQVEQGIMQERSSSPVDEEVMKAYGNMAGICADVEPWHLYDPTTPLHYTVNRVKSFIDDVASQNATPFMHRYLYRDYTPPCILSCFATSVLYTHRTQANTSMVMRAIHNGVKKLVNAETGHIPATPLEKLARTQALFLYQIIRLLHGDVTLRAQGESDIALLQAWLGDLCKVRENLSGCAQYGHRETRNPTPKWESWIFAECVRRTIIMAHSFLKIYEMMRGPAQGDDQGVWACVHRWTISRHLWEAKSPSEFAHMWKERPQFIISNYSFEHFLQHGRADSLDEFAEILLRVYMGADAMKEFVSSR